MNGDILTSLDYRKLFAFHKAKGALGTIAVTNRKVHIDYGVISTDPSGKLDHYDEKPTIPYAVSMGINILSSKCLAFIPEGKKFDMPDLMLAMHRAEGKVYCYASPCYWQDIGRMEDYNAASEDFQKDPARFLQVGTD
jgi:NDP-sugar pyrophosphorylase family protein